MNQTESALCMCHELFGIGAHILTSHEAIESYCSNCSSSSMDSFISTEQIVQHISNCTPDNCIEVIDHLHVHHTLFLLDDIPIILGPFITEHLSNVQCRKLISNKDKRKDTNFILAIQSFRSSFPKFSSQTVIRMMNAILTATDSPNRSRTIHEVNSVATEKEVTEFYKQPYKENYVGLIQERYQLEQRFMENIRAGNATAAIRNYYNLFQSVSHLKESDRIQRERIGSAITRTLIRIAAFDAGLPSVTIDILSTRHTLAIFRATTTDETIRETQKTIRDFCNEILKKKNSNYSNLVLAAKQYIERYYSSTDISLDSLCDELSVSPNYFIKIFKKELGITPMNYLQKVRLEQACRFLAGTDLQVSQISSLVGILDSNYFTRIFRKTYGKSPIEYRKERRI